MQNVYRILAHKADAAEEGMDYANKEHDVDFLALQENHTTMD